MMLLLFLLFNTCMSFDYRNGDQWEQFKAHHNKIYSSEEENVRKEIFINNLKTIEDHNLKAQQGLYSYTLGINKFADMTNQEYKKWLNKNMLAKDPTSEATPHHISDLPDHVDWRESGIVPLVYDQGQCGDASATVIIETLEEQEMKLFKTSVILSYQQLQECCANCSGCTGFVSGSGYFDCLVKLGGIESETDYPSRECGQCQFDPSKIALKVLDYITVPSGDELVLKQTLANVGPVGTGIDASSFSFQLYSRGIYDEPNCSSEILDHYISIVGYGVEGNKDYWIVKNSWGTSWGEDGYIRMSRNKNNQCGIATEASYPIVISTRSPE